MALYPLCQHGEQPRQAVQHASEVIERTVVGDIERADGLALLSIFGKLAFPRIDVNGIIGRNKMKDSQLYREAKEEGDRVGRVLNTRQLTLDALRIKFGADAIKDVAPAINTIDDVTALITLNHFAVSCSKLDEFRAFLPTLQPVP